MRNWMITGLAAFGLAMTAAAQTVPGYTVEDYAFVTDPLEINFASDGNLFAGRDNRGSGGGSGDAVRIHRIGLGGLPVVEYGAAAIEDPDSVLVDDLGLYAPAGSVLVASSNVGLGGGIRAVLPDESIVNVFAPNLAIVNPNGMEFDNNGRLLVGEDRAGFSRIITPVAGVLSPLITLPVLGASFDVQTSTNDIFVRSSDGLIRRYDENGVLLNGSFSSGLGLVGALAFGPGNSLWGSDLYAVNNGTGELIRIDGAGVQTVIGTGFTDETFDIVFGADGFMYLSVFDQDKVIRIVPEPTSLALLALGGLALLRRRS